MNKPLLTIGMAHYQDYDGAYFTIQALRTYHPELVKHVEFVLVDNDPDNDTNKMLQGFVRHWAAQGTAGGKYVPMVDRVGTSASREKIFEVATAPWVLVVDCHVLLLPGALQAVMDYIDRHPDSQDLLSGPLVYDDLTNYATHFDDTWRGEMWGAWGSAWRCCQGGVHFSPFEVKNPANSQDSRSSVTGFRDLSMGFIPLSACGKCGRDLPTDIKWNGHVQELLKLGYERLGDQPELFEIPGQGLGLFLMRKAAWPGFNPHASGFGGEELYIHEKIRQRGGRALCMPQLRWVHRFGRPRGVPYPLTRWNKVRNYVLEFQELEMDLGPVHQHFVESGLLTQAAWEYLLKDPVQHVIEFQESFATRPAATGDQRIDAAQDMQALYTTLQGMPRDLDQHMPKLRDLAAMCPVVTEISMRRESTVALLHGGPKKLTSYQSECSPLYSRLRELVGASVDWRHQPKDSKSLDAIEPTDLLFIDSTTHTGARLYEELSKYGKDVRRFIVIHDTKTYSERGEDGGPGLLSAIRRYMRENPQWSVIEHDDRQHGLTILGTLSEDKPQLPSTIRMAANLATAVAEHVTHGARMCTKSQLQERLEICTLCPNRAEGRCTVCGCFLSKKAAMATQQCPLGKWPEVQVKEALPALESV